jgi:hypothetical protein
VTAETDGERRAIAQPATQAADTLPMSDDQALALSNQLARLTDPRTQEPAPRMPVFDDPGRETGRHVTPDEWAAEHPNFAKALAAIRAAQSTAEATENIAGVMFAREWDMASPWQFELYRETELEDDGSIGRRSSSETPPSTTPSWPKPKPNTRRRRQHKKNGPPRHGSGCSAPRSTPPPKPAKPATPARR